MGEVEVDHDDVEGGADCFDKGGMFGDGDIFGDDASLLVLDILESSPRTWTFEII